MSVPVKLRASADYDRPLFHPGQILSDAELTRLAECDRSLLAAEGRRHGWGVIRGLLPFAVEGTSTITIGPGMLCDRKGRLFELAAPETRNVSEVLDPSRPGSAPQDGEQSFDLWLTIESEEFGGPVANLKMALEAGYAPAIERAGSAPDRRAVREAVTARLELRPAAEFEAWAAKQGEDFEAFQGKFNKTDAALSRRQTRLAAVADAMLPEPAPSEGVALGRLTIATKRGASVVAKVDWAEGRHEQSEDGLPVIPSYVNLAPLFDLTEEQALAWLAHRGIQPWPVKALDENETLKEPHLRNWRLGLRAGGRVTLYTDNDRVVLAEPGLPIAEEIIKLRDRLARAETVLNRHTIAIVLLFVLGAVLALLLFANWK